MIVAKVLAAGAAADLVEPGMELRQVQGVSIASKSHEEVISLIRQSSRPLKLVFSSPESEPESESEPEPAPEPEPELPQRRRAAGTFL
eukprot:COSAG02_NODE_23654_length_712_cov_0.652529_1_plen_87_part_10